MKKECELSLIVRGKFDVERAAELLEIAGDLRGWRKMKLRIQTLTEEFLSAADKESLGFEIRRESE